METSVYYMQLLDEDNLSVAMEMLLNHPRLQSSIDTDVVVLSNTALDIPDTQHDIKTVTIPGYFIDLYRKRELGKNERETVLSHEDYLIAIQLILAEYNKKENGDFDVEASEVLHTAKMIMRMKMESEFSNVDNKSDNFEEILRIYEDYLVKCNSVDMVDVYQRIKIYIQGSDDNNVISQRTKYILVGGTRTELEQSFVRLLCGKNSDVCVITMETPLEGSNNTPSDIELIFDRKPWSQVNFSSSSQIPQLSATEIYVRRVIFAYLTLLVNSRNEIALARCLNIPDRELDHQAFTALKKIAKDKNMPMFQTAVSFVTRVHIIAINRLLQPEESLLSPYVKGMSLFINMIQKLQTIIEEDPDTRSSVTKVLNVIKSAICKSSDVKLRKSSVETVTDKLHEEISQLFTTTNKHTSSPQVSVSNGGSMAGRKTIRLLRLLLDHESCQDIGNNTISVLSDSYSSQKTPLRFPSLLSQFRSPDQCSPEDPENQTLIDRVVPKVHKKQSVFEQISHQSCMTWATEDMLKKRKDSPMTIYHDVPDNHVTDASNQSSNSESSEVAEKRKELKKRILEEITDEEIGEEVPVENAKKRPKTNTKEVKPKSVSSKENKTKKSTGLGRNKKKTVPLQKGQKQMTSFFRM